MHRGTTTVQFMRRSHGTNAASRGMACTEAGNRAAESGGWPQKMKRYVAYFDQSAYQTVCKRRAIGLPLQHNDLVGPGRLRNMGRSWATFYQLRAAERDGGVGNPCIVAVRGGRPRSSRINPASRASTPSAHTRSTAGAKAGTYAALAAHTQRWWNAFRATGCEVVPLRYSRLGHATAGENAVALGQGRQYGRVL